MPVEKIHLDNSFEKSNIFVRGLDKTWSTQTLYEVFDMYGEIKSAKVSVNPLTGRSNGYGFIWFKTEAGAQRAIKASIDGETPFTAELYKPKNPSPKQVLPSLLVPPVLPI
jgi:RNA recognition motif-containing protein